MVVVFVGGVNRVVFRVDGRKPVGNPYGSIVGAGRRLSFETGRERHPPLVFGRAVVEMILLEFFVCKQAVAFVPDSTAIVVRNGH